MVMPTRSETTCLRHIAVCARATGLPQLALRRHARVRAGSVSARTLGHKRAPAGGREVERPERSHLDATAAASSCAAFKEPPASDGTSVADVPASPRRIAVAHHHRAVGARCSRGGAQPQSSGSTRH